MLLVRNGTLAADRMRTEGITVEELEAAARHQGFASLKEVDKAMLEASGGITFIAKKPRPHEVYQQVLLRRLDQLSVEVKAIRARLDEAR